MSNEPQDTVADSESAIGTSPEATAGKWKPGKRGRPPKWANQPIVTAPKPRPVRGTPKAAQATAPSVDPETLSQCVGSVLQILDAVSQRLIVSTLRKKGYDKPESLEIAGEAAMTESERELIKTNGALILSRYDMSRFAPEIAVTLALGSFGVRTLTVMGAEAKPKQATPDAVHQPSQQ
jgi:hypothetical protein